MITSQMASKFIAATLIFGAVFRAAAADLVAYYPFEESSGDKTADASGHAGPARLRGMASFSDGGKFGGCVRLGDFEDWVDTGKALLDTARSYSIAAWINLDEGFEGNFRTIVSQDDRAVSGFYLLYRQASALALTQWSSPGSPRKDLSVVAPAPPQPNRWIHIAAIHDAQNKKLLLYLDGALAGEQTYNPAAGAFEWPASGHTVIGRGQYAGNQVDFFAGCIDEVYLFQGVLTVNDIQAIKEDRYLKPPVRRAPAGAAIAEPKTTIVLDPNSLGSTISPLLFGHNLEHTRHAVWQGLSAELLANRKFAGPNSAKVGDSRPRGQPDANGVAAHWYGIGLSCAKFRADTNDAFAGAQSQRVEVTEKGVAGGVGQESIPVKAGEKYTLRFRLKSDRSLKVWARMRGPTERQVFADKTFYLSGKGWQEWTFNATALATELDSKLEVTFDGPGVVWFGAASMLPADHFHGMRRDVVKLLKEMSVPILRWPGGNFTADYLWKDGLLPVDRRPPINAVCADTLPFSDNYDFHDIGIDEYMALCHYLGAEPFLTINLNETLAPPQEAADWVEYCNGSADTKWGKLRAERGHSRPYHVKYWTVGNEIWGPDMGAAFSDAATYAKRLDRYARAMKQVDPTIILVVSGFPNEWDKTVAAQGGDRYDLVSEHNYAPERAAHAALPRPAEYSRLIRFSRNALLQYLQQARECFVERCPQREKIGLAFDEWNVWHDWFVSPFNHDWRVNAIDGACVASTLNTLCREGEPLHVALAAYFQPVNEGAIVVEPFAAKLTAVGQVFSLFRIHQGNRLVGMNNPSANICASVSENKKHLFATLINGDAVQPETQDIALKQPRRAGKITITYLQPATLAADTFALRSERVSTASDNVLHLTIPPASVVLVDISLQ